MKKLTSVFLLIFWTPLLFGQIKTFSCATEYDGTYSLWFQNKDQFFKEIGSTNLSKSKEKVHIRFTSDRYSVDIWSKDSQTFQSSLTLFTRSYNPNPKKSLKELNTPRKLYYKKNKLDSSLSIKIYKLLFAPNIVDIPSGKSISGWETGEDGITYVLEYSSPTYYSFKEYWTPDYYKNQIKEAAIINNLSEQLDTILNSQKSFDTFINSLPEGCYKVGGSFINCREKQKK